MTTEQSIEQCSSSSGSGNGSGSGGDGGGGGSGSGSGSSISGIMTAYLDGFLSHIQVALLKGREENIITKNL